MIRNVVREHHWPMSEIESLYLDDADFFGLEWWHNDVEQKYAELKKKK